MERWVIHERGKNQTKSLIFSFCGLFTMCNPSTCKSLSCNSSTGRLLAMIQDRLVTNMSLPSSWLDLQMKQLYVRNTGTPCTNFEWQAVWCRARRKGIFWEAFMERNSTSRPWVSISQERHHQEVRSSMSSFSFSQFSQSGERIKYSKDVSLTGCCHYPLSEQGLLSP